MMRRHLYLVTEHENEERIGDVIFSEHRRSYPTKNEEGPIEKFNPDTGEFRTPGKQVGLGYVDFEDEDDLETRAGEVAQEKVHEIDREWVEKAGLEDAEWFEEVPA